MRRPEHSELTVKYMRLAKMERLKSEQKRIERVLTGKLDERMRVLAEKWKAANQQQIKNLRKEMGI